MTPLGIALLYGTLGWAGVIALLYDRKKGEKHEEN